jgi:hypothetical protein
MKKIHIDVTPVVRNLFDRLALYYGVANGKKISSAKCFALMMTDLAQAKNLDTTIPSATN